MARVSAANCVTAGMRALPCGAAWMISNTDNGSGAPCPPCPYDAV